MRAGRCVRGINPRGRTGRARSAARSSDGSRSGNSLIGCERAALGTSTLHLFWDLFGTIDARQVVIYADAGLYPIGWWGIERAVRRGAQLHTFPHHDGEALQRLFNSINAVVLNR